MTGRMNTVQPATSFRTTTPTKATTGEQVNPVQVPQDMSHNTHLESTQWKDFCEQTPIDKARHSITIFWLL